MYMKLACAVLSYELHYRLFMIVLPVDVWYRYTCSVQYELDLYANLLLSVFLGIMGRMLNLFVIILLTHVCLFFFF